MRRRISLAILGTVAAALLLAGSGTYVLLRAQARGTTERNLRSEAQGIAALLGAAVGPGGSRLGVGLPRGDRIRRIADRLRLEGIGVVAIGPRGQEVGPLPDGVTAPQLDVARLRGGEVLSGSSHRLVWAAAADIGPQRLLVVVLTRTVVAPRAPLNWFLVAGGITLLIGAAVSVWLSGTLTRPLQLADAATRRIAEGDLSARLPEPGPNRQDEVADLTRSINTMAATLDRSRGLERQFLLSVSHDLRTPLTSIRGYAEAIDDGTAPDPRDAASVIRSEAQRLERLVGDLLDLARLEAHQFSLAPRQVALDEVVTDTAEGFRPAAEARGVALDVQDDPAGSQAVVDPDRLAQVVANLVENGLKFAAGALWVRVDAIAGGQAAIQVVDDGPGIAPADLPHVFERLYVARHQPRPKESGSGLGLAIVRELVGAMGGWVHAESPTLPNGTGTRFVVVFPTAAAP
ncbi:MAG: histidine kinase [Acidimicrobiales bacterium]|nr:histidine kinase [Acidimicrobiales bacterium]